MSVEEVEPCLAVEGSTTAEVFEAYVEHFGCHVSDRPLFDVLVLRT